MKAVIRPGSFTRFITALILAAGIATVSSISMAQVNINTATKEELMSVKGIGAKKAESIIKYRKKHGKFKSIEDLSKVKGFGKKNDKKFAKGLIVGKDKKSKKKSNKAAKKFKGVVNINTASKKELMQVPGMGKVKAQAIVDARKKGKFEQLSDLNQVKGFGKKTIAKMSKFLTVK